MKNKQVKQMMCDAYLYENSLHVEWCKIYTKGFYCWHYPPCEGGWFVTLGEKSLTANQLRGN